MRHIATEKHAAAACDCGKDNKALAELTGIEMPAHLAECATRSAADTAPVGYCPACGARNEYDAVTWGFSCGFSCGSN